MVALDPELVASLSRFLSRIPPLYSRAQRLPEFFSFTQNGRSLCASPTSLLHFTVGFWCRC